MSRRIRSPFGLRWLARVVLTMLVLCGVAAGSIGFPVTPAGLAGGDFPCQGHGCGCRTAADCWLGCCCLTPAQRLAWAERRGVTPPAELVTLARSEKPPAVETPSCCGGHGAGICRKDAEPVRSCCGGKPAAEIGADGAEPESSEPGVARGRCRGFGQFWVSAGQPFGLPEKPVTIAAAEVRDAVAVASVDYAFGLAPPPTGPG